MVLKKKSKSTKRKASDTPDFEDMVLEGLSSPKKPKKSVVGKIKKQESVDSERSTYFKIGTKVFNPSTSVSISVYIDVDPEHIVTEYTPKGTRLLVARYPDFHKIYLCKIHQPGELHFPYGGITAYNYTDEMMQYFSCESVAIHPDGGIYRFRSEIDK